MNGCRFPRCGAAWLAFAAVLLGTGTIAPAADRYWSGTGTWDTTTANWGTATGGPYDAVNWSNAPPDSAIFEGTAGTVTLGEAITAAGLTFETTGYTLSGDTLTLSGTPSISTGTGISATIASVLAGSDAIEKTGAGTLTLSAANTHSGGTTVSGGTIVLGTNTSLGSGTVTLDGGTIERDAIATVANSIAVGSSGGTIVGAQPVVDYTSLSGQLTGSGPLTLDGLLNLSGTGGTYSGTITLADSDTYVRFSSATALAITASISGSNGGYIRLDGNTVELSSVTSNAQVFNTGVGTTGRLRVGSGSMSGPLVNNEGQLAIEKIGSGALTISGSSSYTGGTTITAGTLQVASGSALGSGTVTLGSADSGADAASLLITSAGDTTMPRPITVANQGSGTFTIGATNAAAQGRFSGAITLNRDVTLSGNATDRTDFRGGISGTGNISIAGTRVIFLSTQNTYAGTTTILDAGNLQLSDGTATATSFLPDDQTVTVDSGGFLRIAKGGNSETIGGLAGAGRVQAFASSNTLIVGGGDQSATFSGLLENNAGTLSFEKIGTGTQTLTGNNTSTGSTTVSAGTLVVGNGAGSGALGSGAIGIASGATLTINRGGFGQVWGNNFSGEGTLQILAGQDPQFSGDNSNFTGPVIIDGAGAQFRTRSANAWSGQSIVTISNGGMASVFSYVNSNDIKAGSLLGDGTVRLGGTDRDLYVGGNNLDAAFSGAIINDAGGSGSVIKLGTGTQTFSGSNSYSGGTIVSAGTLVARNANAFGTTGTITLGDANSAANDAAVLIDATAGGITIGRPITVANQGTGTFTLGSATASGSSTSAFTGAVSLARDVTLQGGPAGGRLDFAGGISGTGNVTIDGTTRVIYRSATNTYAGSTTINGILQLSDGSATATSLLPDAQPVTVASGGFLRLAKGSNSETIGALSGSGTVTNIVSGTSTLILGGGDGSGTFSGLLDDPSGTLAIEKIGAGTQTFSAASTYAGSTTISGGTLVAGNANAFGTSGAISVGASGTLGVGDGVTFSRPFSLTAGGRVRTGNNSIVGLPSVAALAAWESQSATGDQTLAEILDASGSSTPTALFSAWTANPDTSRYFSDILTLEGTGAGNTYVLSMEYSGSFGDMNIWYRENVADAFVPLGTSFAGNVPWTSSFTTPGQYGVDTSAGTVWAVTDHNSQFVVVPEPGTLGLAAMCLAGGIWYLRGRQAAGRP